MPNITLYSLTADAARQLPSHSMHVNKTKSDLAILGIAYTEEKLTFAQSDKSMLRIRLRSLSGSTPANPPRPLPIPDAHRFARFIASWTDNDMALSIRQLFRPLFYDLMDPVSAEYFLRVRYQGKADELESHRSALKDIQQVETMAERARQSLNLLESYLAATSGPFFLGKEASHADSIVYGWYCCSQVNARVVNPKLWYHPSLPKVGAWVDAMKKRTGVDVTFPELDGYAY
ncbi:hypothetical protein CcaverHIS002_0307130 [Cutaneotrichosporon cavernicola]|nr:hypothetical protein CcaverHIS002_0307130 [Cutaneotrichosporon cavernicola]